MAININLDPDQRTQLGRPVPGGRRGQGAGVYPGWAGGGVEEVEGARVMMALIQIYVLCCEMTQSGLVQRWADGGAEALVGEVRGVVMGYGVVMAL
ncbi:hypothetical protein E2C01_035308 [Portunus trituberculatus]|uniref:Uncharacterized protein n=1 Tax=Portunus trituberculatus TaxID=210409 RepID=A0A5B7F849_PORTR|nr:hypothetical protein [Portunus trituberculatus]